MDRKINLIVIHCSATPDGRPNTIRDIDAWHKTQGWERKAQFRTAWHPELAAIGYHYVITVDGLAHPGRSLNEIGAHVAGLNSNSIGICMVGTARFTSAQWAGLADLVRQLKEKYPAADIKGHRDCPGVAKACPGFDVVEWLAGGMEPLAGHLLVNG